jgi:hypothetical protein
MSTGWCEAQAGPENPEKQAQVALGPPDQGTGTQRPCCAPEQGRPCAPSGQGALAREPPPPPPLRRASTSASSPAAFGEASGGLSSASCRPLLVLEGAVGWF